MISIGYEPEQLQSQYPFPGAIHLNATATAYAFAHSIYSSRLQPRRLVLWADGSTTKEPSGPCVGAIGYCSLNGEWHSSATIQLPCVEPTKSSYAEFLALGEAFRCARALEHQYDEVLIFSDAKAVLRLLQNTGTLKRKFREKHVVNELLSDANYLYENGFRVELHWVPRRAGVAGHMCVDRVTKVFRRIVCALWPKNTLLSEEAIFSIEVAPHSPDTAVDYKEGLVREYIARALSAGTLIERQEEDVGQKCFGSWRERRAARRERKLLRRKVREDADMEDQKIVCKRVRLGLALKLHADHSGY